MNDFYNADDMSEVNNRADKEKTGKLPYELLPVDALEEILKVYAYGAKKYAPRNWEKGMPWTECYAALMRHANAWRQGIDIDPESGLPHMACAGFWSLTLLRYEKEHQSFDDRQQPVKVLRGQCKCENMPCGDNKHGHKHRLTL